MNQGVAGGAYFRAKGVVHSTSHGGFAGLVQVAGMEALQIDCAELETVVPAEGGAVLVLRGAHRGASGTVARIHVERYCADVQLAGGGPLLQGLEYTDFSRFKGV